MPKDSSAKRAAMFGDDEEDMPMGDMGMADTEPPEAEDDEVATGAADTLMDALEKKDQKGIVEAIRAIVG